MPAGLNAIKGIGMGSKKEQRNFGLDFSKNLVTTSTPIKKGSDRYSFSLNDISKVDFFGLNRSSASGSTDTIDSTHSTDKSKDSGYSNSSLSERSKFDSVESKVKKYIEEVKAENRKTPPEPKAPEDSFKKLKEELDFKNILVSTLQESNNTLRLKVAILENKLSELRVKCGHHCGCCPYNSRVTAREDVSTPDPSLLSGDLYYFDKFNQHTSRGPEFPTSRRERNAQEFLRTSRSPRQSEVTVWSELSEDLVRKKNTELSPAQSQRRTSNLGAVQEETVAKVSFWQNSLLGNPVASPTLQLFPAPRAWGNVSLGRACLETNSQVLALSLETKRRQEVDLNKQDPPSNVDSNSHKDWTPSKGKNRLVKCLEEAIEFAESLKIALELFPEKLERIRVIGQDIT